MYFPLNNCSDNIHTYEVCILYYAAVCASSNDSLVQNFSDNIHTDKWVSRPCDSILCDLPGFSSLQTTADNVHTGMGLCDSECFPPSFLQQFDGDVYHQAHHDDALCTGTWFCVF